jgi:hypothetical protein
MVIFSYFLTITGVSVLCAYPVFLEQIVDRLLKYRIKINYPHPYPPGYGEGVAKEVSMTPFAEAYNAQLLHHTDDTNVSDLYDASMGTLLTSSDYWCPPCASIPSRPCSECSESAFCNRK